jgi:heterogeneous nuclear ribonucleoprotein A1/A3
MEIVQEAAKEHRDVREQVRSIADKKTTARKLFVRGNSSKINSESLNAVFSPFGELVESVVIMNKSTRKSKGYNFVTFAHVDGAQLPDRRPHDHDPVCLCGFHPSQPHIDVNARKIYVGNVPVGMDADRLVSFFSQYDEIDQGPLGFDKNSGRSRGYALFIFKTVEATKCALEDPSKTMDDGHQFSCKLANERHNPKPDRVNSTTTANWFDIHPLNHTERRQELFLVKFLIIHIKVAENRTLITILLSVVMRIIIT